MVQRQGNYLGQGRLDVPDFRSLESSVAADMDVLAGRMIAGRQPLVLQGFRVNMNAAVGSQASALQVLVADSLVIHYGASESGSIFWVPSNRAAETLTSTNTRVGGSFTASQTNYVGIDLTRLADDSTVDNQQFLDINTRTEVGKSVPKARTLDYRFVIGTANFSGQSNVLPIAKVVTDASNNVVSVTDARQMMFRLGTGGDSPNRQAGFVFPSGRVENITGDVFSGGDKAITNLKDWMSAVMSRIQEIGGGSFWYSPTADRNVNLVWTGTTFTNGEHFEWIGAANLHWKGLRFVFDNSSSAGVYYNDVKDQTGNSAGLTDLADGECIYVDLDRTQNLTGGTALTPVKVALTSLGASAVPGARHVLAWRSGADVFTWGWRYPVGTTFTAATTTSLGVVELNQTPASAGTPKVVAIMANGRIQVDASGGASAITGNGDAGGAGIVGNGGNAGAGGVFTGGAAGGSGATGTATSANTSGLFGSGSGSGGSGVTGLSTGASCTGVLAQTSHAAGIPFRIVAQAAAPTSVTAIGDMYVDSATGILYIGTVVGTPGTWTKVGAQ